MPGTPAPSPPDVAEDGFALSIVVRASRTVNVLAATLDALRAQTMPRWEAIVVDDGSAEATTAIVERHSATDSRIRSTRCATGGPSAARNAGIRSTSHPWLLFLDAGETIHPTMLARVRDAAASGSTLDAVHCGWAVFDDSGHTLVEDRCEAEGDLFVLFARRCAFPLASCAVRRSLVEAIGGFDLSARDGEDWLFWQRIARRGARFGRIADTLVHQFLPLAGESITALEVTAPITDVAVGPDVERAHFVVSLEGAVLGVMELYSSEGRVDAAAIRDAVADRFGWLILGRFFERTLHVDPARHDADGWSTLIAQLWPPDPPPLALASRVIDRAAAWLRRGDDGRSHGMPRRLIVEAGRRVRPLLFGRRNIDAELRVAGVRVASAEIAVGPAAVTTGAAVRAALADAAGVALCRVLVRDVLLGAPVDGTASLSERIERVRARQLTPS